MIRFLESHTSPELIQDAIDNPNCAVIINEMEIVVQNLPKAKFPVYQFSRLPGWHLGMCIVTHPGSQDMTSSMTPQGKMTYQTLPCVFLLLAGSNLITGLRFVWGKLSEACTELSTLF